MQIKLTVREHCAAGDALTPLRLLLPSAGEPTLTVMRELASVGGEIAAAIEAGAPVEKTLRRLLLSAMAERGYAPERRAWVPICVYAAAELPPMSPRAIALCDLPDLPWTLTHRRAELTAPAYAVVADGAVVAAAWTGDEGIAVETAPEYRRRGYARAAASAVAAALLREGRETIWRCSAANAASCALAASLGMAEVAHEWRPVFRKC